MGNIHFLETALHTILTTEPRWGYEKIFWWSRYYDIGLPTFVSLIEVSGDLLSISGIIT